LLKIGDLGFQQGDLLSPTPPVTPTIYYSTDWDVLSNFLCQCPCQLIPLSLVQVCLGNTILMVRNGKKTNLRLVWYRMCNDLLLSSALECDRQQVTALVRNRRQ